MPILVSGAGTQLNRSATTVLNGMQQCVPRLSQTCNRLVEPRQPDAILWRPEHLTATRLWLKGDELAVPDGTTVASWTDSSGNGLTPTTFNTPSLKQAFLNSKNVVEFTNADSDYFTIPAGVTSGLAEGSVFFVAKRKSDPGTDNGPVVAGTGTSGSSDHYPFNDANIYDGFLSTVRKTVGDPGDLSQWHLGSFQSKASDYRYAFNATDFFTTATNTVGASGAGWIGTNGTHYFDGYIAEIVFCSSFLTTGERQKVEGYLAWKWGLQASLSVGHPYLSAAPLYVAPTVLTAAVGSYSLTGTPTALAATRKLTAAAGSYTINGTATGLKASRKLAVVPGAYSITGTATSLRIARKLAEAVGNYSVSGTATGLRVARKLAEAVGNYSIAGTAAALRIARKLAETVGIYSVNGTPTGLKTARRLATVPGAYALNGSAVTLTYTPTTAAAVLIGASGNYSLTGLTVTLRVARRLNIVSGLYVLTGNDVDLIYDPIWDVVQPVSPAFSNDNPVSTIWTETAPGTDDFTETVPDNGIWTVTPPNTGTWD